MEDNEMLDLKKRKGQIAVLTCLGMLWGIGSVFGTGVPVAQASYHNPYTKTPEIRLSQQEEAAYLDKKTKALFNTPAKKPVPYVVPKGWQQDLETFKNVRMEKYTSSSKKNNKVLMILPGGGYIQGNHNGHRDWALARAEAVGSGEVYMLDYRFYPEAQYPDALHDAVAAYQVLLQDREKGKAKDIVVVGDSAGSNLTLALALYLRDHKMAMPNSLVLYSAWGDVEQLPSRSTNKNRDVVLGPRNTKMYPAVAYNKGYFRNANLQDPYVSPVYADFTGLPPMLLLTGGNELFVDDSLLVAQRAKEAGVKVENHIYPGMSHDWPLLFPELPASRDTYRVLAKFVNAR